MSIYYKTIFFVIFLFVGNLCVSVVNAAAPLLSDSEWEQVKVRTLSAPYEKVWRECLILLNEKGFSFNQQSKPQGIMVTNWIDTTSILSQFGIQLTSLAINDFLNTYRAKSKLVRKVRVSFFFKEIDSNTTQVRMNLTMRVKLDDFNTIPVVDPRVYDSLYDEVAHKLNLLIPHVYEDLPQGLGKTTPSVNIVSVIDGDTIKVRDNGKFKTIEVIGMDAPEMKNVRSPKEFFAKESRNYARKLFKYGSHGLSGSMWYVYLQENPEYSSVKNDKKVYAHLFLPNGTDFAQHMILQGYAKASLDTPFDEKLMDTYRKAEEMAQKAKRGLWQTQKNSAAK